MADVNIGELAATTLRNRSKDVADAAVNNNALTKRLKAKGRIRQDYDGRSITLPVIYDGNGTAQRYSGFEVLNINDGKVIDAAEYFPVQAAVHFTISGREAAMNSGKSAAVKLVDSRLKAAKTHASNFLNQELFSDGSLTNQMGGLQQIIADDPTTSTTIGGINQNTYTWWRNQVYDFSDNSQTAAANMLDGMNSLWISCSTGSETPDLIVMSSDYYNILEKSLQQLQRYATAESGDIGFPTLMYKTANVVFDKSDSGMPASHAYFINTDYIELAVYKNLMFEMPAGLEDGLRPINQDGYVFPLLFMGNLVTDNRKRHGVLKT